MKNNSDIISFSGQKILSYDENGSLKKRFDTSFHHKPPLEIIEEQME